MSEGDLSRILTFQGRGGGQGRKRLRRMVRNSIKNNKKGVESPDRIAPNKNVLSKGMKRVSEGL